MYPQRGSRGLKIGTPLFSDSLTPNQPDKANKSTLARKSYGITLHPTLIGPTMVHAAIMTFSQSLYSSLARYLFKTAVSLVNRIWPTMNYIGLIVLSCG